MFEARRCALCDELAVQRVVKPSIITFRCAQHTVATMDLDAHGWRAFAIERANNSETRSTAAVTVADVKTGREPSLSATKQGAHMSEDTKTKAEPVAPKPGRGYTVVELRTPKQASIVKSAVKGFPADTLKIEDRWVVVKNTEAQAVVDKTIAAVEKASMFEGRVLTFFVAVVLLTNKSVTDSRTALHSRLIAVGRNTDGFVFVMKGDGTVGVTVGSKEYPTQKAAMEALAPDQLKAVPSTPAGATEKAKAGLDELNAAKAERKALKEWEAQPEGERGPRPDTSNYDRLSEAYEAKEAAKAKEAEARKAEAADAAAAKTATKDVNPIPKATKATARKAS